MTDSMELLCPAGSPESVKAAVQSGADAIYLGSSVFNARRNAKNFSMEELSDTVKYCHRYGVKVHVTLNILLTDRELREAESYIKTLSDIGVDAVIVQDLGVAKLVREVSPDLPMHASTQMSVHSLDGVRAAAELGFSRVVLARELSETAIRDICKDSPVEIEVFAHGALCMCYSGQCYMSGLIGQRSGNRGLCAQPCRMKYSLGDRTNHPILSLKDLCLADKLNRLKDAGVASIKVEGRMKRPEYVALVTSIYRRAIDTGIAPSRQEISDLELMFSRDGFTDGYFTEKVGASMFGARDEIPDRDAKRLYDEVRRTYEKGDARKVPVTMEFSALSGSEMTLKCVDADGNMASVSAQAPQIAEKRSTTKEEIEKNLRRVGNTPFSAEKIHISLDEGLLIPLSVVNNMRRECLDELTRKRESVPKRQINSATFSKKVKNTDISPALTISVMSVKQISEKLLSHKPDVLYVPLVEASQNINTVEKLIAQGQNVAVTLPRVITSTQEQEVLEMLNSTYKVGVREALCGNLGHIALAKNCGFSVRGDFGLNVFNSETLGELKNFGLLSGTLSFELRLSQIRDISKSIPTEAIVYGRLPLMVFENCIVKASNGKCTCDTPTVLTDRTNAKFPVVREYPHRNQLLNAQKLWLADKTEEYENIGLWAGRLMFTTESAAECADVIDAYINGGGETPKDFTRGLYFRGVE